MVEDQKAAAKRGEVGLLDFDHFIDAQDWEISAFDIAVEDGAPGKARHRQIQEFRQACDGAAQPRQAQE